MNPSENTVLDKVKYDLRKYPVRPHIGVGGLLLYRNKILLIKRKYDPGANLWSIPGGHLKLGETCKEGAVREFQEETMIEVKAGDLAGIVDTIILDEEKKIKYHYVLINYHMEIIDERFGEKKEIPPLEAHSDAADIRFVPIADIPNYKITKSLKQLLIELSLL